MIPLPLTQRDAAAGDEPFLRTLHADTRVDDLSGVEWPDSVVEAWLRLQYDAREREAARRHPAAVRRLLLIEDEPAGAIWVDRAGEDWQVLDIALLAPFRGLGFGAHALQALLAEAMVAGAAVTAEIAPAHPARRLFDRLGFVAPSGAARGEAGAVVLTWSAASFVPRRPPTLVRAGG